MVPQKRTDMQYDACHWCNLIVLSPNLARAHSVSYRNCCALLQVQGGKRPVYNIISKLKHTYNVKRTILLVAQVHCKNRLELLTIVIVIEHSSENKSPELKLVSHLAAFVGTKAHVHGYPNSSSV